MRSVEVKSHVNHMSLINIYEHVVDVVNVVDVMEISLDKVGEPGWASECLKPAHRKMRQRSPLVILQSAWRLQSPS